MGPRENVRLIPLSGRIVAVADVFDALTHRRPYNDAWLVDDAVAEIPRLRGAQFDPAIVDAFLEFDAHDLDRLDGESTDLWALA